MADDNIFGYHRDIQITNGALNVNIVSGTAVSLVGDYAEFHLSTTPEVVNLNDDGVTYTKIPNMFCNPLVAGFTCSGGTLTKSDTSGIFLINGVSDLEVNKAVMTTYALVVNGTPVPSELTLHTFTNQSKIENISITAVAPINVGDTIEIHIKGDGTLGVTVTVQKIDVTFSEVRRL